jgi:hypothetical protein
VVKLSSQALDDGHEVAVSEQFCKSLSRHWIGRGALFNSPDFIFGEHGE